MLFFILFNDTATTEIYTLSLHDALPILHRPAGRREHQIAGLPLIDLTLDRRTSRAVKIVIDRCRADRKSTRLNSSHLVISYAVFCLKKYHILQSHDSNIHTQLYEDVQSA